MALDSNSVNATEKEMDDMETISRRKVKCCRGGCAVWCRKYFWEGQNLHQAHVDKMANVHGHASVLERVWGRYRKFIAPLIPGLFFHFFWWGYMIEHQLFYLFVEKYVMTVTMIFGGTIAGMTSEGGGAVAFPVMTLALGIAPSVARDFALMIQMTGMSCASITILVMKVKIEGRAIAFCTLGGLGGLIFGFYMIDPRLSAAEKKMYFVSIWFAFASVLLFLNRNHKRPTYDKIQDFCGWKALALFLTGLLGGCFTSFAGSGLDICTFSILTLLFRVSEKVATPTTVLLMAFNSIIGVYWRSFMLGGISQEAWEYEAVCGQIVVFMAPIGSALGTHFHRLVLAALVIGIDVAALIGAFAVIKLTPVLIGVSVAIIVGGFVFFSLMSFVGHRMLENTKPALENSVNGDGTSIQGRDCDDMNSGHPRCNDTNYDIQYTIDGESSYVIGKTEVISEEAPVGIKPFCYVTPVPEPSTRMPNDDISHL